MSDYHWKGSDPSDKQCCSVCETICRVAQQGAESLVAEVEGDIICLTPNAAVLLFPQSSSTTNVVTMIEVSDHANDVSSSDVTFSFFTVEIYSLVPNQGELVGGDLIVVRNRFPS